MSDSEMPKFTPFLDLPLEYGQVLEPVVDKEKVKTVHAFDRIISSKLSGEKKDPNGKSVDRYLIHTAPNGKIYHFIDKINSKFVIEYDKLGEYMIPGTVWEIIKKYVPTYPNINFAKGQTNNKVSSTKEVPKEIPKQIKPKSVEIPSPEYDLVRRKLGANEAQDLYQFDKALGKENKGFHRVDVDTSWKQSHGIVYHYIMPGGDAHYRIRYQVTPQGKLKFTGDVVELSDYDDGPDFDDV